MSEQRKQPATTDGKLSSDEIYFTNVFNVHRAVLAGFARCSDLEELRVVRDGFFLAMASDLCPSEYGPVHRRIVQDPAVADAAGTSDSFATTVISARKSPVWTNLLDALQAKAREVGSDLDGIWLTLETGRIEWLAAVSGAHKIKSMLKSGLENQCGGGIPAEGDVSDAKMIWMYALSLSLPGLKEEREAWQKVVQMSDPNRPLVGYRAELWDCREDQWRPLDLGVQAAAERGGSSVAEAWDVALV
uniref:Uncharacterized protein n=1 Tax=Trieres chinensis TaxID=1514140 RepID=A0A7S1ZIX2_TRICV|mmetsp:Transcript_26821/g.54899  ORF Transcript_26821/g.54899 Transcript_26821/m.54899 type:complete len:246 (+) Transcript_26821:77-814(+)|eukprot:CAMPEP_0183326716 /NCGR_PEP_ID=MMETSP0160_2-20130417/82964_1 /TAXON_ID=2839 ORGANISM="Odontella Sinensis, Strain Grunow 1884" /NCGR_SAMPLE_ID=MMETSP0160_2 /ASSEMBLY_ACC=CAM_ASM_000250 /LENGTH=245 /DNA_ID=CAMNT_0025494767 /DNA_START=74 /DNA_END=811 /DNA_ORIENTATION=-